MIYPVYSFIQLLNNSSGGELVTGGLRAGSPLSHTRERRRAKLSGGKESGEEALGFALVATPRALVLLREPARRLSHRRKTLSPERLRWLKTVSSTFQDVDFDGSLLPLFIN